MTQNKLNDAGLAPAVVRGLYHLARTGVISAHPDIVAARNWIEGIKLKEFADAAQAE